MFLIPFACSGLYILGGQVNKLFRWLGIGILVGSFYAWTRHTPLPLLSIVSYYIATNVFSYGDNAPMTKIFGRWISMALAGLTYGLASIFVVGWIWALIQGIVAMVCFLVIKYYDDKGTIHNPFVELARGFLGTVVLIGG